jgi:hypothetical protein
MATVMAVSIDEIQARGSIKDTDVLKLRRAYYEDGQISAGEADALFALNDACPVQDASWSGCFVEMMTDYLVNQAVPEGYLTVENADWLIKKIGANGRVESKTELDLLITVLDKSRWSPERLVCFALEQVRDAVIKGDGPIRGGRTLDPGVVNETEVELLRRVLYSFGGDGCVAITRAEADILFAINDATASAENATGWRDLFVKAIANCVMAASGYAVPTREEALAREAWLDRRGDLSLGTVVGGMASGLSGMLSGYREQSSEERAIARLERQKIEIITNEEVTAVETQWLSDRLSRDGALTPNEDALIAFLKAESPQIHPDLQMLVDRRAKAA